MRAKLLVAFATIYLVWGSTYLAIAYAVESIPPLLMMGVRSLIAGGLLFAWARATGEVVPSRRSWRPALLAGAFMFLGSHGMLAWSEQRVSSGLAALIVATGTFWMMAVEWARPGGQRPGRTMVGGALLGLVGVGVLVGGGSAIDPLPAGVLLLSSLSWAVGTVFTRHAAMPRSARLATSLPLITGGLLLLVTAALTGELRGFDARAVDLRAALSVAYLIVFGSIVAFTAYVWLLRHTSAVVVSTHNYVNPIVAVVLGWWFAAEPLSVRMLVAGAIIVLSVALIQRGRVPLTPSSGRRSAVPAPRVELAPTPRAERA